MAHHSKKAVQPNQTARADQASSRELDRCSLVFKALGDATRLKLTFALMRGPICVGDLATHLGVGQSAVSHHLRILRNLSLVASRREKQVLYYRLADQHVADLIEICLEHVREGTPREEGTP